jgi:transcriptional regulator with GAF, ATPase, and Fis domain
MAESRAARRQLVLARGPVSRRMRTAAQPLPNGVDPIVRTSRQGGLVVSKFDLRDISERLTSSKNTEAVLFEFLGYLQAVRPDWHATLAFYEVSRDALVNVYQRSGNRLQRKDLLLQVDSLPPRLVRKFFHPSAFFNHSDRKTLLAHVIQSSPYYELTTLEASAIRAISPIPAWQSAICMPLSDQDDILAMLTLASEKKNSFPSKAIGELLPIKAMASLALAQHLHRAHGPRPETNGHARDDRAPLKVAAEFHEQMQRMGQRAAELEAENLGQSQRVEALVQQIEQLDQHSSFYKNELDRVKGTLSALEQQSAASTQQLSEAYTQLDIAVTRLNALQHTMGFLREVCQVIAQEHEPADFARTMVAWFSEHFGVERCSLMLVEAGRDTLRIAACVGIDPGVAREARVRIGQGIAGWVAHNRKPLYVKMRDASKPAMHTGQDAYNSDSFVCVPLVHNNRMFGVLSLSNKKGGEAFEEYDFDRAVIAGSLLAITLGHHESSRRAAAWS